MIIKLGVCIYIIIAMFHLVMSFKEFEKYRKISKPLLMLSLVGMTILFSVYSPENYLLIIIGAVCGLLGDILLIYQYKTTMFITGGIFFFIGHVFYMLEMMLKLSYKPSFLILLLVLFALIVWTLIVEPKLKPKLKKVALGVNLYAFILVLSVISSLICLIFNPTIFTLLLFLGYLMFLISDSILLYASYYKKFRRHHFYLMLPYIIAQCLIIIGLLYI